MELKQYFNWPKANHAMGILALLCVASTATAQLSSEPIKSSGISAPISLAEPVDHEQRANKTESPAAVIESDRTVFKDWILNCAEGSCIVHQYLLDEKKRVISSVSLHQKADDVLVTFTVPLMTRIDRGVNLSVTRYDEKELYQQNYGYSYCTQIGCMLTYDLNAELAAALEAGRKLKLTFAALDGREVTSIHSLFGFSRALENFKNLPEEKR